MVADNKSLAEATGFAWVGTNPQTVKEAALKTLTPEERQMYDDFQKDEYLGDFDAKVNRKPVSIGAASSNVLRNRVVGLNNMYKRSDLLPENVAWWQANYTPLIPLLCAYTKIANAVRALQSGQTNLTAEEFAEYTTCSKASAVAARAVQIISEEHNRKIKNIQSEIQVLKAREHALKAKLNPNVKRKHDPKNEELKARKKAPISDVFDLNEATRGARDVRLV